MITRVCRESRSVAHESGSILPDNFGNELPNDDCFICGLSDNMNGKFWINPRRDFVNLNWHPGYEAMHSYDGPALACLAWQSCQVIGPLSYMDDWIHSIHWTCVEEYMIDVLKQIPEWRVIVRVVIIHASFQDAAETGLFGLLGDASVQIAPVSDEKKLNALYKFADECDYQACYAFQGTHWLPSEALSRN